VKIQIHPHAAQRMRERGATTEQVRKTVAHGRPSRGKFGRTRFRKNFAFGKVWLGRRYANQQIDAFAAKITDGWLVVTVIVKYF